MFERLDSKSAAAQHFTPTHKNDHVVKEVHAPYKDLRDMLPTLLVARERLARFGARS
ncbi:hypothetical protein BO443_210016 [Burkholderia orbicola]